MGRLGVYGVVDQRDGLPFYVGQTNDMWGRYVQHMSAAEENGALKQRVREMLALGFVPHMVKLEDCESQPLALIREAYWIHHYLAIGVTLLNKSIPAPLHLRSYRAKAEVAARVRHTIEDVALDPEALALRLHQQGLNKREVIKFVWNVSPGGGQGWIHASAIYDRIVWTETA